MGRLREGRGIDLVRVALQTGRVVDELVIISVGSARDEEPLRLRRRGLAGRPANPLDRSGRKDRREPEERNHHP
jgi:hypothetical protein